jgi:hypothetical protein
VALELTQVAVHESPRAEDRRGGILFPESL